MQQDTNLRRRHHHKHNGDHDDDNSAALRDSLLARSGPGDDDDDDDHVGAAAPTTTTTTTSTAGPLIVRPRPFSLIAFLSAVVERWFSVVWGLVGAGTRHSAPTTVAGARRAAAAPSTGAAAAAGAAASAASEDHNLSPGLQHLRTALAEPYRPDDSSHQDALLELWSLALGADGPAPPTKASPAGAPGSGAALRSPRWQEMGWQGLDPATDFRGAGRFGLENLLRLGRARPRLFASLLRKQRGTRSAWEYPFCVAGLNLTFALSGSDVLGLVGTSGAVSAGAAAGKKRGSGKTTATTTPAAARAFAAMVARAEAEAEAGAGGNSDSAAAAAAAERAFDEVYAAAFAILDAVWLERGASYMEFGGVMAEAKARLARALARCGGEEGEEEDGEGGGARRWRVGSGGPLRAWTAALFGDKAAVGAGGRRRRRPAGGQLLPPAGEEQPPLLAAGGGAAGAPIITTARALARAAGVDEEVVAML